MESPEIEYGTKNNSPERRRTDARQQVADKWASRRKQKEMDNLLVNKASSSSSSKATTHNATNTANTNTATATIPPQPSFCYFLKQLWDDVALPSRQQQQQQQQSLKKSNGKPRSSTTTLSSFPSVLSILQANELKHQVEFMDEKNDNDNNNNTTESILSVLPATYNFTQAIMDMSQTRSRAFLLLDLAAIVKTHVCWRKQLGRHVQFSYQVQHNSNPKLLTVLQRLQVGLRVATKYDLDMLCCCTSTTHDEEENEQETTVDRTSDTVNNHKNNNNSSSSSSPAPSPPTTTKNNKLLLLDNTSSGAKPNSFYRKLVLDQKVTTLAVDGPDEVSRLHHALTRMSHRRHQQLPSLSFLFRVPQDTTTSAAIIQPGSRALLQQTQEVAATYSHKVVGISLELPSSDDDDDDDNEALHSDFCHTAQDLLTCCCCLQDDNKGAILPQLELTGLRRTDTIPTCWMVWFLQLKPITQRITLDVSYLLVANAGALCTRIIGVKQNEVDSMHYYIDDGCYGSLYNSTGEARIPLPLKRTTTTGCDTNNNNNNHDKNDDESSCQQQILMKATVWGPTCDGLDKVCCDLELPVLARDDWLVFPNLGFCNVGTAFNGFAPPDTAYCVLGGYLHRGIV